MSPTRRVAKHPQWTSLEPAEMNNDQLQLAAQAVRSQLDGYQSTIGNLTTAWLRVQAEINSRFSTSLPGVPAVETMAPWPEDFMKQYDWSTHSADPVEDPSADVTA